MKFEVRVIPSAMKDLTKASQFYENRSSGLGNYFTEILISEIERLADYGGIHPVFHGKHRALSKRFPYSIYYKLQSNQVLVIAVIDDRRHPNWIEKTLRRR
jgi:plasmid stabilization system protein ParE